ncbi:MAG: ferrous iron transport protein A [Halodesulfurarchaeum sp.]
MRGTLTDISAGASFEIEQVGDDDLRAKLRRLGFLDGRVDCRNHLRKGPVVVSRRGTELALGADVAAQIRIREVDES